MDDKMKELISLLRAKKPAQVAEELLSVQPMEANIFSELLSAANSETELIENGYHPVSHRGLLWMKKKD